MSRFSEILASLPETPRRSVISDAIEQTMASQGTVISKAQLELLGAGGRRRKTREDAFQLYDAGIARGIYKGHAGVLSPEGRRWAAQLWAPEPSWFTGASSAALLGLERPQDAVVHLVTHADSPSRKKAPGVYLQRTSHLPAADLTETEAGFRCTQVARALLDLCAKKPRVDRLTEMVNQAEALRIYDHPSMHRVIERHPKAEGAPIFKAALARIDENSFRARSIFETKLKELIESSPHLPPVAQNAMTAGVESDFSFPGTRALVEADSRAFHRTTAQIVRDAERDEILLAAGFQILRVLWRQVQYEQEATLRRIVDFYRANVAAPDPSRLAGRLRQC